RTNARRGGRLLGDDPPSDDRPEHRAPKADRPSAGATLDRSPRRPPPGPLRPSHRALTRRLSRAPAEKREEVSTTEALRREELTAEDAEDAEKREHRGEEEELHHGGTEGTEKKRAL